jgi:hypothetical protein
MKNISEILKESFKAIDSPELEFKFNGYGSKKPDYIVLDPLGLRSTSFEYSFESEQDIKLCMKDCDPEEEMYATYEKILNLKFGECQSFTVQYQYHLYYIRISK